jgi:hypothetical protein
VSEMEDEYSTAITLARTSNTFTIVLTAR